MAVSKKYVNTYSTRRLLANSELSEGVKAKCTGWGVLLVKQLPKDTTFLT